MIKKKNRIHLINNPIIEEKLSMIRNIDTKPYNFRKGIKEISKFLLYEASKSFNTIKNTVQTPVGTAKVKNIDERIIFCPILRAALGMLDGMLEMLPNASVGFIGFQRNEITLKPEFYYEKISIKSKNDIAIIIDPMLATGGTAIESIKLLKDKNINNIIFISILSSPEGIEKLSKTFNDVNIYTSSIDERLNNKGYIIPGLGDAGDRIFNT